LVKIVTSHCISIVGTGYVGLCTAVCLASKGYKVVAYNHNVEKIAAINKGIPPFYEPGLVNPLKEAVKNKLLRCTLNPEDAVLETDITFIAVGTPSRPDGSINLQYIKTSAKEIGKALYKKKNYHLIVVKSTVVPGTTEKIVKPLLEKQSKKQCGTNFGLCMNPEFLREGLAIHDTLNPDRIILGEHDKKSGEVLEKFYKSFYSEDCPPIIRTNLPTAELIKYASNAFLATKISFTNEIANICQKTPKSDITIVAKALGLDHRINSNFLNAGLGYGGSCFPKDVKALIAFSKSLDYDPLLLNAIEEVNKTQPYKVVELAKKLLGDLRGRRVAILGLAFKPNTDDMREAVSIKVVNKLLEERASVIAYDPAAMNNAQKNFEERIEYAQSIIECIKGADCCIIVTEWEEFKRLKPNDFIQHMKSPIVIDGRRIYDPKEFSQRLKFAAIGYNARHR